MKCALYIVPIVIISLIGFGILCFYNPSVSDYVKYNIFHRDYLEWKHNGGPLKKDTLSLLLLDRNRSTMVAGISEVELLKKYPFLVSMDKFGSGTYKDDYKRGVGYGKEYKLYWFDSLDGFDWVVIIKDGIGQKVILIKG